MFLHPYFLDELVRDRQATFLAEAATHTTVAEALRAKKAAIVQRIPRPIRIVRPTSWSSHQPGLAIRTDMPA